MCNEKVWNVCFQWKICSGIGLCALLRASSLPSLKSRGTPVCHMMRATKPSGRQRLLIKSRLKKRPWSSYRPRIASTWRSRKGVPACSASTWCLNMAQFLTQAQSVPLSRCYSLMNRKSSRTTLLLRMPRLPRRHLYPNPQLKGISTRATSQHLVSRAQLAI